ncbi:MAG TPA: threonine--tRNA ligase [Thermotogota bacterium]|nr:threonine--tRNA ligase [Thermotogota bacterium]
MEQHVQIRFPDGKHQEVEGTMTSLDLAREISPRLAKESVAAMVNGGLVDLTLPLGSFGGSSLDWALVKKEETAAQKVYRHTLAHVMAQAVTHLFGAENVQLGIGPTIENGFYYDIMVNGEMLKEEDIAKVEKEMKRIVDQDLPLERFELPREQAIALMKEMRQPFKVELIEELPEGEAISFYRQGDFVDLCRGPHLPSTGKIKHFKLLSLAGAYWRGDEKNPMLQRLYGTAFASKDDLDAHLKMLEEARKRDHRRLGPQLGLFLLDPEVAAGMPFFQDKGVVCLQELKGMWRRFHREAGYVEVMTPLIMHEKLWHQSGHWDHYRDNMYFVEKDEQSYAIKPMNCPGHIILYKSQARSYRDLPWRMAEFGKVHRFERSGVLHGLFRVRAFTQDDAHLFITPEQINKELVDLMHLVDRVYRVFGFAYFVELSTRPEDFMGSVELWDSATESLRSALEQTGVEYHVNEGDGAFYGPKIDFHVRDSLGRTWQCATVQLDFQMPERFDVGYIGADNEEHRTVMIHRTVFGSLERFFGILVEHFAGAFPAWLAPVQFSVLPIADRHFSTARSVEETLQQNGFRVTVDDRQKKINFKIREAQLQKIPYMLIIGDREQQENKVSLRLRSEKEVGAIGLDELMDTVRREVSELRLESFWDATSPES